MPWRSSRGGCGGAVAPGARPMHRDQVLVVGAVELVLVGERARFAPVVVIWYCAQAGSWVGASRESGSV